jgi:serine/threonine protein kinase
MKKQIENGIKILQAVDHSNIMKIFHSFIFFKSMYLVFEYFDTTLDKLLQNPLSYELSLQIFGQIVDAIEYAHSKNIVIQDLKPEYIFIKENGQVKICFFEFSNQPSPYSAPEINSHSPMNQSCDIWSAGCILYQMLTGSIPFFGANTEERNLNFFNFAPDVQQLLFRIFSKDNSLHISAKQIAQSSLICQIPRCNLRFPMITENDALSFPMKSSSSFGFFDFISRLSFNDFLSHVSAKSSEKDEWSIFNFICTFVDPLKSIQMLQISFASFEFEITGYRFQTTATEWILESFVNEGNSIEIHTFRGNTSKDIQLFDLEHAESISNIKVIIPESKTTNLIKFDIFGNFRKSFSYLLKGVNKPKPILDEKLLYSFSLTDERGFLSLLSNLEASDAFFYFHISSNETSQHSSLFNALKDNDQYWFTNDVSNSRIEIQFMYGFMFHLTGFRFKNGPSFFPRSWKISGQTCKDLEVLKEFRPEKSLLYPYDDNVFEVASNFYFDKLVFEQTGLNSDDNNIFCLSLFDIYGEMKYFL